jgi:hypothetical protein
MSSASSRSARAWVGTPHDESMPDAASGRSARVQNMRSGATSLTLTRPAATQGRAAAASRAATPAPPMTTHFVASASALGVRARRDQQRAVSPATSASRAAQQQPCQRAPPTRADHLQHSRNGSIHSSAGRARDAVIDDAADYEVRAAAFDARRRPCQRGAGFGPAVVADADADVRDRELSVAAESARRWRRRSARLGPAVGWRARSTRCRCSRDDLIRRRPVGGAPG